jgi:hypothetical protein
MTQQSRTVPHTTELLDSLAVWLREQIEADLPKHTAGDDEWIDLKAKLNIIADYQQAAEAAAADGPKAAQWRAARFALGRAMRHLSMKYTKRPGWLQVWRIER